MTLSYTYNIIPRVALALIMMTSTVCAWAQEQNPEPEPDPKTYVAQISEEQKFETLQAAITAATETPTTITLLADITAENEKTISVSEGKDISLLIETHTISSAITNAGTLAISDGTISGAITNSGSLSISGGTISGSLTNSGTLSISGGTFSTKPDAGWIADGSEVMVGENSTYVVASTGTAEAKIVANEEVTLYQTIALAIAAAESTETTVIVLKDIATVFSIAEGQNITLSVTEHTISGAITNSGTLNIYDGSFTGTITNNGTLNITGGTFTHKPSSYTCEEGKDLIINEGGLFVVADAASAEAEIDGNKYLTLDKAITAAGTTATTISILKDPEAESLTIPAGADIIFEIETDETFVALTKPITNSGALTIVSGAISSDITIDNADATVKIADGVTSTSEVAISSELQTENVLKTSTAKVPGYTNYWVEKKFEANVDDSITDEGQKIAADALAANTALSSVAGLGTNQSLVITITSVTLISENVTHAEFNVVLKDAQDQEVAGALENAVTFHLPISAGIETGKWVNLKHNATPIPAKQVVGSDANKYVEVITTSFSPFSYDVLLTAPVAQIGETKYETVAAAITASADEDKVELLANVAAETPINVAAEKNISLSAGEHSVSGAVTNAGTLSIVDGTFAGAIFNSGALTIEDGTINGAITATAGEVNIEDGTVSGVISISGTGSLTISGGTITSTSITTAGSGSLNITNGIISSTINNSCTTPSVIAGGIFSGAITNSGDMTISGGTFGGAITSSDNTLAISGGEFNDIKATGGTISITDGTFTGTIAETSPGDVAISGGTHTNIPAVALCAPGYVPEKNSEGKYNMTNNWLIEDGMAISTFDYLRNDPYVVATARYHRNTGMVGAGTTTGTKYGTVCLPFAITAAPAGITLYTATAITASTLTITEVTYGTPVPAGTPLIFELTAAATEMNITSNDATLNITTAPATAPTSGNLLVGTYIEQTITEELDTKYYLNGDKFHQAKSSLKVPAYRAYLKIAGSSGAKPLELSISVEGEDITTGIGQSLQLDNVTAVYDLNGRRQHTLQPGVNILQCADGTTFKVVVK